MNSDRRHNQTRDPKRNIDPLDINSKTFREAEIAKNICKKVVKRLIDSTAHSSHEIIFTIFITF